jgi:hypothetical protein
MTAISRLDNGGAILDELRADLSVLDDTLRAAIEVAREQFGAHRNEPRFAGLVITGEEPARLLGRPLSAVVLRSPGGVSQFRWRNPRLMRVVQACGLTVFDTVALLLALAPEIDLRYERIFAYLQDDVTRKRPSIALSLDLFAPAAASKITLQERFRASAPLRQHGLLELVADAEPGPPPLPAHGLRMYSGVTRFLLGEPGIDEALTTCAHLEEPDLNALNGGVLPADLRQRLITLGERSDGLSGPTVLFEGADHLESREAAEAVAVGAQRPLLTVDLNQVPIERDRDLWRFLRRTALLHDAVLHLTRDVGSGAELRGAGLLFGGEVPLVTSSEIATSLGQRKAAGIRIALPIRSYTGQRALWQGHVRTEPVAVDVGDLLTRRFRFSPTEIRQVVESARGMAQWRAASMASEAAPELTVDDLMEASRALTRGQMEGLACRIVPRRQRSELILPADRLALLDAIRSHVEFGAVVAERWGFARTMTRGAGIVALFSGPPGTGKTLAAEVLAGELGLDLYAIDLSQVVNKYIGETEKNLARVFDAAESSNAVLFFDEADALFGARSEVHDAHDRYANIEVSYLLQRMEEYSGLAVLASNLQRNMDEAFLRRLRFVISFPLPDADGRRRIWETTWPAEAPHVGLDWAALAARFDVAGATIRDAAVGAAFLAAADGGVTTMGHIEEAMRREYSKLGRVPADVSSRAPARTR